MTDIFISYARSDRSKAQLLAEACRHRGWDVWWDRNIPPGRSFDAVVESALDSARCVVVLWSKESIVSDWVKTEAAEGARRGVLVPALLEDVKIPLEFRRLQTANLSAWPKNAAASEIDELLAGVASVLSGATAPVAPQRRPASRQPDDVREPARRSKQWSAELLERTFWAKRKLRVHLTDETHTVEYLNGLMGMSAKVDGITAVTGGTPTTYEIELRFELPDGTTRRAASIYARHKLMTARIAVFRLTVDERILYAEDA